MIEAFNQECSAAPIEAWDRLCFDWYRTESSLISPFDYLSGYLFRESIMGEPLFKEHHDPGKYRVTEGEKKPLIEVWSYSLDDKAGCWGDFAWFAKEVGFDGSGMVNWIYENTMYD